MLKLIADIGLLGYPNAGKSTLLAALTRAFPKIAPYPFTTMHPYLGHLDFVDGKRVVMADLPGIIEGAHENKGLGLEFLKHIERTKGLLYVIDGSGLGPVDALDAYKTLNNELKEYNESLIKKPSLIALNKCDMNTKRFDQLCKDLAELSQTKVVAISAKDSINLEELTESIKSLVPTQTIENKRLNLNKILRNDNDTTQQ